MNKFKGLLKSKVFWFNVITSIGELANLLAPTLPPGTAMAVNVIGNIVLRFFTNTSLENK